MNVRERQQKKFNELNIDLSVLEQWNFVPISAEPRGNVFMLETDVGTKCLKIVKSSEDTVFHLFLLLEHLAHGGFKKIPRFIRTKFGEPYLKMDQDYYYISDWINGRPLNIKDQNDVIKAIRQLAQLHRAAKGFHIQSEVVDLDRSDWEKIFFHIALKIGDFNACIKGPAFLKQSLRVMADRALVSCKILRECGYSQLRNKLQAESGFCHGSYNCHHIMINMSGEVYITGFHHWARDISLHDLVYFMSLVGPVYEWDSEIFQKIILNYDRISPLFPGEIELMQAYLCFPFGYWALLKKLAQENAGPEKTKDQIDLYLQQEEQKQKALSNLTQWVEGTRS